MSGRAGIQTREPLARRFKCQGEVADSERFSLVFRGVPLGEWCISCGGVFGKSTDSRDRRPSAASPRVPPGGCFVGGTEHTIDQSSVRNSLHSFLPGKKRRFLSVPQWILHYYAGLLNFFFLPPVILQNIVSSALPGVILFGPA